MRFLVLVTIRYAYRASWGMVYHSRPQAWFRIEFPLLAAILNVNWQFLTFSLPWPHWLIQTVQLLVHDRKIQMIYYRHFHLIIALLLGIYHKLIQQPCYLRQTHNYINFRMNKKLSCIAFYADKRFCPTTSSTFNLTMIGWL